MQETLLVSRSQVEECVSYQDVLRVVEDVFAAHGSGLVTMPAKITLDLGAIGEPNWINAMPAFYQPTGAAGIKWAGGFLHNGPRRDMDYVQAMMIVNDPLTGFPAAVMDAVWITNARTGAVPAVVAKYMLDSDKATVALIGAGMQARWALRMLPLVKEIESVRVFDINAAAAQALSNEIEQEVGIEVEVSKDIESAVRGANLVVTVTTADKPLVRQAWVSPGALVVSMGSYQELEADLVLSADLRIVDHLGQNLHRGEFKKLFESGVLSEEAITAEFGEIVAGRKAGRSRPDQVIVASMIGVASIDIAIGRAVYEALRHRDDSVRFGFDT